MGEFAELCIDRDLNDYLDNRFGCDYDDDGECVHYSEESTYYVPEYKKFPYHNEYKTGDNVIIKKIGESRPIETTIVRTTGKAVLFKVDDGKKTHDGYTLTFWMPKAAMVVKMGETGALYLERWATIKYIKTNSKEKDTRQLEFDFK